MKNIKSGFLRGATAALCAALLVLAAPSLAAGLTVAEAINPFGIKSARLSPDGKHIGVIGFTGLTYGLMVIDADTQVSKMLIVGRRVKEGHRTFN